MRQTGTPRLLVSIAVLLSAAGCVAVAPDPAPPPPSDEVLPSPMPEGTNDIYDADEVRSTMLTAVDAPVLERLGLVVQATQPDSVVSTVTDVYGEGVATSYTEPDACGPIHWLSSQGLAERDSEDPLLVGPVLEGNSREGGDLATAEAHQRARVFDSLEAAQRQLDEIVSALRPCYTYEFHNQSDDYSYDVWAAHLDAGSIQLHRELNSSKLGTNSPFNTDGRDDWDAWIFLKANVVMVVEGQRDDGDMKALATFLKQRLDDLGT